MDHYVVINFISVAGGTRVSSRASMPFQTLDMAKVYADYITQKGEIAIIVKAETTEKSVIKAGLVKTLKKE